jgi:hypothetical protein
MKTQTSHAVALYLDQLLTLWTLVGERALTIKRNQDNAVRHSPGFGASRVNDIMDALRPNAQPSRRSWVVLRAFVTLLLTIPQRTADAEHSQPQNSGLPDGAVRVALYLSR